MAPRVKPDHKDPPAPQDPRVTPAQPVQPDLRVQLVPLACRAPLARKVLPVHKAAQGAPGPAGPKGAKGDRGFRGLRGPRGTSTQKVKIVQPRKTTGIRTGR
jgi:hypothetical protein